MAITKLNSLAIPADTVVAADIADGSITAAKLADDAVTSAKIADDAVVAAAIADNAVVTAAIADDAVTTAKTTVTGANPNLVINGSMQVAQKPTLSHSGTNSAYGEVDRWMSELRNVGTYSVTKSTSVVPEGFSSSLEVKCTTADASLDANSYGHLTYKFEGRDVQVFKKGTSNAIAFALSFWVRSSKTGTYATRLRDNTNARYISKNYTISSADTWEYKTVIFPADTTGAIANSTASGMSLYFWFSSGTDYTSGAAGTAWGTAASSTLAPSQVNLSDTANATWYLTGVKLEAAAACTAYEMPTYTEELQKCQRYYWVIRGDDGPDYSNNYGFVIQWSSSRFSGWNPFFPVVYPQEMRAIPTFSVTGTLGSSNGGTLNCTGYRTRTQCGLGMTGTTASSGAYWNMNSTDDRIQWDAEL
jgi:hypothetical protein